MQKGFTLVELMVVVAIVGILLGIAIPSYSNYLVRARVAEMLTVASAAKLSVSDYRVNTNAFPATMEEAGMTPTVTTMVNRVTLGENNGVITVSSSAAVTGTEAEVKIILTPTYYDSHIAWACTSIGKKEYIPVSCR